MLSCSDCEVMVVPYIDSLLACLYVCPSCDAVYTQLPMTAQQYTILRGLYGVKDDDFYVNSKTRRGDKTRRAAEDNPDWR